jgi:hypothetical protein
VLCWQCSSRSLCVLLLQRRVVAASHRRDPLRVWALSRPSGSKLATLAWVAWFNHHGLMQPLGCLPPAELEANDHQHRAGRAATV